MSADVVTRVGAPRAIGPAPLATLVRLELVKQLSQWRVRLLLLACWTAPGVVVAVVARQGSLPADTVFGRWLSASGWAAPLVVLAFAGSWVLPVVVSLVAGDVFALEDRLGTWRHLVVTSRSVRRVFWAKALTGVSVVVTLVAGLAVSSTAGGLVGVGDHPLAGLDGHLLVGSSALRVVALAWACALAPTLALTAVGWLGAVTLGRSPMALALPALAALGLALAQLLPLPLAVRLALPSQGYVAWRGLTTAPAQMGPLLVGLAVDLAWVVVATAAAYVVATRRGFAEQTRDGLGARALALAALPLVGLLVAGPLAVAPLVDGDPSGIDRPRVEVALATSWAHLYRLQTDQLGRPAVTEAQLATTASCDRGGERVADTGPGRDWRCEVTWHLPGAGSAVGTAVYQLDVTPDGRFVADGDGPQPVNGFFTVRTPTGDQANPLWQVDGLVDLLGSTTGTTSSTR